jgi:hypothetical protein
MVPAVSWWFVTWRARVLDDSTGTVESSLPLVATALERLAAVGGVPGVHLVGRSSVVFEFWFEAGSPREASGGARATLRQALRAAGVGDPIPPQAAGGVLLMLEELPTLQRDDT